MADETKQPVAPVDAGKPIPNVSKDQIAAGTKVETKPVAGTPAPAAVADPARPKSYEERAQGLTGPTGMTGETGAPPHSGSMSVQKDGDKITITMNANDPIALDVMRKAVGRLHGAGRKAEAEKLSGQLPVNSF